MKNNKELLANAREGKVALGAFNFYDLESARAIVKGAEQAGKDIFLQLTEKSIDFAGFDQVLSIVDLLKKSSPRKILLHLDHGKDVELVKKAIASGFDSVMFDGSNLGLENNIMISGELRKIAHRKGVIFEGEVGHIGSDDQVPRRNVPFKTNPSEALRYYEEVKPDLLAVAFGNIHGPLTGQEQLDFSLLAKIAEETGASLAIHGCSNRNEREYKTMTSIGAVKINVDTALRQAFFNGLHKAQRQRMTDPRDALTVAELEMTKTVSDYIEMFS